MTKKGNDAKRSVKGLVFSQRLWVVLLAAVMIVSSLPVPQVQAAVTFTVDRTDDDVRCRSL
jgi:hypothetical protein